MSAAIESETEERNPYEATGQDDLVTPRQLVAIRNAASYRGLNCWTLSEQRYGTEPESLNRRTASAFIGWINQQPYR